ncbi:hypothetical protein [Salipiger sp. CCB-MM3]|uniref:hypothetical protein n=1 Tax=Salipiger sp. CCB-MM3 TaxID=1792508 RepID=UPI0012F89CF6|nr:hypothetical protein [Salipiger sp. CCB-MM3]
MRAVFDAAEHVFKISFKGSISLNKSAVQQYLKPAVDKSITDTTMRRASQKNCDALVDWTDACHNYRHVSPDVEPKMPSEELTVLLVSQGFSYVRWLVDLRRRYLVPASEYASGGAIS